MPRVPESELQRLKEEIAVERLVEACGVELKRAGKDWLGRCPFHADDTASLVVTPAKNLWHCFGCGIGGGPIDWVMKTRSVSFRHAVELLREGLGACLAAEGVKRTTVRTLAAPVAFDADDARLLGQVAEYYHATLKTSPEALAYLESRGIQGAPAAEAIDAFKLGYANRTLGLRLPQKTRKAGAEIRARLEKLGVYRESGHEHLNGSLVIPLMDAAGQVVNLYGRKLLDNLRAGTPKHLYLPGPRRGLFNPAALAPGVCQELIVCEALIDALTFWCAGYRNVTSCYGVSGLTDELLTAITSSGAQRILIAFDRDEAGDRGAGALAQRLMAEDLECFRLLFPKGEDANSYALLVKPAAKSLGVVIRSAEWMGAGKRPELPSPEQDVPVPVAATQMPEPAAAEVREPAAILEALPDVLLLAAAAPEAPAPEPAAAAMPTVADPEPAAEADERQVVVAYGPRRYRVRGLPRELAEALKVNVLVASSENEGLHVDTLDLYQARQRQAFAKATTVELGVEEAVIQRDLGRLLLKLEALIDERTKAEVVAPPAAMTAEQAAAALAWLRSPQLIERIVADAERVGLVGEPANALVAYLACVSRKLASPLAVLIQSTSAAGKSTLMDTVLALMPEQERVHYSAMTGQSLFYLGEQDLKHRILAIAEEEGVRQAAYALKVLQSQGELTIASTGKDPATGMLVTQAYRVEGPVMLFLTTTAIDVDEELVNRCLVLTINESREQTRRIQQRQRAARTLEGLMAAREADAIRELHRNAQRLLRPLAVVNPYAEVLTFLDDRTRTRRDHAKYLTLIEAIALLHQHQRAVHTVTSAGKTIEYIEATLDDIALANRLAHEVLGRSLDDLPPQTRRVLGLIEAYVAEQMQAQSLARRDVRFTRRELRGRCGLSDAAIRVHLERLVAMEYVRPAAGRNGLRFEYELAFDGDLASSEPQMIGLIDVKALRDSATTATSQGSEPHLAGRLQAARTDLAPALQGDDWGAAPSETRLTEPVDSERARHRAEPTNGRRSATARAASSSLAAQAAAAG